MDRALPKSGSGVGPGGRGHPFLSVRYRVIRLSMSTVTTVSGNRTARRVLEVYHAVEICRQASEEQGDHSQHDPVTWKVSCGTYHRKPDTFREEQECVGESLSENETEEQRVADAMCEQAGSGTVSYATSCTRLREHAASAGLNRSPNARAAVVSSGSMIHCQ